MKAADLRKAILQYAVEGKLVPQDIHDEPASILYEKIIAEKENLIKQGKIKKEKPLPPITDDDIPYNIPENWKWVRLGEVAKFENGDRSNKYPTDIDLQIDGIPFISSKDIIKNKIKITEATKYIKDEKFKQLNSGKLINNDIVFCLRGSVGKHGIFNVTNHYKTGFINAQLIIIRMHNKINIQYIDNYFDTPLFKEILAKYISGSAVTQISATLLQQLLFPLPPLKEQERIVKKIDELMALCDKLEQEEEKLLALDKNFMENLPKSILQYAVEGKLVNQDIYDEPASILYEKIIAEKENLIKQGKIKKEKPLPPITDDDIPYNIPENWKWVRLGEVCSLLNGNKIINVNLPLLNAKYLRTRQEKQIYTEGVKVNKNDYIILVDGENSGEVFKAFEDGILGSTFKILNINSNIYDRYILYMLYFYKDTFKKSKKGAAIPHLDKELFKNILTPLPPLKEQERIVKKVDELLTYCNKLKDIV